MNNEDFIKFYDNNFNKEFGNFKFNDNPMTFIKRFIKYYKIIFYKYIIYL